MLYIFDLGFLILNHFCSEAITAIQLKTYDNRFPDILLPVAEHIGTVMISGACAPIPSAHVTGEPDYRQKQQ